MDRKTFSFKLSNLDPAGRTMEGYANVFNVKDAVGDIVHPGAFAKTLVERGGKIKLLWQHDPGEPIGKPVELREDTNGLFIKAVISDTARGRDALALLQDGAIGEMSIGYDAVKGGIDFSKDPLTGEAVRNLREIKLYEVSLVTFPANEYAVVTALKEAEVKAPMKTEDDGEHPAGHYLVVEDAEKPSTWHLWVRNAAGELDHRLMGAAWAALHDGFRGSRYEGPGKAEALAKLKRLYEAEGMDTPKAGEPEPETKAGRVIARRNAERLAQIRKLLEDLEKDAGLLADEEEDKPAPEKVAVIELEHAEAGPADVKQGEDLRQPPTLDELLQMIEIEQSQLSMID